ncbi:MAG: hypothetical protein ACI9DM_002048 [Cyclobacteriaceae bacterium]
MFAIVQHNDPDPFIWIFIYGMVALIAYMKFFGIFPQTMVWLFMIATGLFMLLHMPYVYTWMRANELESIAKEMKADQAHIEGTREFFGLLMATGALSFFLFYRKDQIQ